MFDPFFGDKDTNTRTRDLAKNQEIKQEPIYEYIYPEYKMRDPEAAPSQIFIPTKAIMFKMMRSCIKCANADQLWYKKKEFQRIF